MELHHRELLSLHFDTSQKRFENYYAVTCY